MTIATTLLTLAAAVWVGAIVFQTAVVAPTVFASLDEAAARLFLRRLFPRFFQLGICCGVLMIAAIAGAVATRDWTETLGQLAVLSVIMLLLEVISLAMVPRINAARDAGEAGKTTFSRLHLVSVLLTLTILLLGIGVLAIVAMRAAASV
ncbi:MAG: DUF4149 domain-containing protein [Pseudomonadota bacterium]